MEVRTKLGIGDKIYFLRNGQIATAKIDMIKVEVRERSTEIVYYWEVYDGLNERHEWKYASEKLTFSTKEALVEHLLTNFKEEENR